jgi:hypothetical protein
VQKPQPALGERQNEKTFFNVFVPPCGSDVPLGFAENKGLKLRIDVNSVHFVTPETAIEDGITSVISRDGTPPNQARYTNRTRTDASLAILPGGCVRRELRRRRVLKNAGVETLGAHYKALAISELPACPRRESNVQFCPVASFFDPLAGFISRRYFSIALRYFSSPLL